jgi:hypothetical protein
MCFRPVLKMSSASSYSLYGQSVAKWWNQFHHFPTLSNNLHIWRWDSGVPAINYKSSISSINLKLSIIRQIRLSYESNWPGMGYDKNSGLMKNRKLDVPSTQPRMDRFTNFLRISHAYGSLWLILWESCTRYHPMLLL